MKLILSLALPFAAWGARVGARGEQQRPLLVKTDKFYGVPELDVLYTSSVDLAADFLKEWEEHRDFGLFVRVVHSDNHLFFPVRAAVIGISRGTRVLLFDMAPHWREVPRPLPDPIAAFLENDKHIFYGQELTRSAGRLAFECDVVIQGIDFNRRRAWPRTTRAGGLYELFNTLVSTEIDLWRPDNLVTMTSQARHAYLQWAVADHLLSNHGDVKDRWLITKAELYTSGPIHLRVPKPKHDWTGARATWMREKHETAGRDILRNVRAWQRSVAQRPRIALSHVAEEITSSLGLEANSSAAATQARNSSAVAE